MGRRGPCACVRESRSSVPDDFPGDSLEVVRTPDGDVLVEVDGEPLDPALAERYAGLVAELEGRGAGTIRVVRRPCR